VKKSNNLNNIRDFWKTFMNFKKVFMIQVKIHEFARCSQIEKQKEEEKRKSK
jgi:hypothetical protein